MKLKPHEVSHIQRTIEGVLTQREESFGFGKVAQRGYDVAMAAIASDKAIHTLRALCATLGITVVFDRNDGWERENGLRCKGYRPSESPQIVEDNCRLIAGTIAQIESALIVSDLPSARCPLTA